jgi:hypothetical protein
MKGWQPSQDGARQFNDYLIKLTSAQDDVENAIAIDVFEGRVSTETLAETP